MNGWIKDKEVLLSLSVAPLDHEYLGYCVEIPQKIGFVLRRDLHKMASFLFTRSFARALSLSLDRTF